jgi:hypothetical protein
MGGSGKGCFPAVQPKVNYIAIKNGEIDNATIAWGDSVVWMNQDATDYTLTALLPNGQPDLAPDNTWAVLTPVGTENANSSPMVFAWTPGTPKDPQVYQYGMRPSGVYHYGVLPSAKATAEITVQIEPLYSEGPGNSSLLESFHLPDARGPNKSESESEGAARLPFEGASGGSSAEGLFPPPSDAAAPSPVHPHRDSARLREPSDQSLAKTLECTPQLEIREALVPKKVYRMSVFVDRGPFPLGAEGQKVIVMVPQDVQTFPLDVWLDCSSHFRVEETADSQRITVNAKSGVSDELDFILKVLNAPDGNPMYVSAFFRHNGRPCGRIKRFLDLKNDGLYWKTFVSPDRPEGAVVLPRVGGPPLVSVNTQARPAEIRIEVLRTGANDGQHYTLKCYTPQSKWEGPWNLPQASKDLVNMYMQTFMSREGLARIKSLESAGIAFWRALPEGAKELLWSALEKGAGTMSVVSEEPFIPWELMVPHKRVQKPRNPLGVELRLGRWITGDYTAASQHVPMKSGHVICPRDSGLKSATEELAFLIEKLAPGFTAAEVLPATFVGVNDSLGGPPRNVIHFICHGKSALLQTLDLNEPDTLDCSEVLTLEGFHAAFKDGPMAFLNACEVGGQVLALDGVGGFANSFIELGASAVVAPLWPVQDKIALEVTQTFYTQALAGVPFAEIMMQIRAQAYEKAIDSYAAYCFYGDPMASAVPEQS